VFPLALILCDGFVMVPPPTELHGGIAMEGVRLNLAETPIEGSAPTDRERMNGCREALSIRIAARSHLRNLLPDVLSRRLGRQVMEM